MSLDDAFEAGARDGWQRPEEVMAALSLAGGETVIDVGAGTGYFTRHLAARAKRVIAVEPEPGQRARLSNQGFEVVASLGEVRAPADLIFAANVLRFLSQEDLRAIADLTRRVVLIDWKPGPRPVGPPEESALSMEEAIRAFPRFRRGPAHEFLAYQWMVELERVD